MARRGTRLRSNRLNFLLIFFSTAVLAFALVYALVLVKQKAKDERRSIQNCAFAMRRQEALEQRVRTLYANMETEERQYAMVWSFVYERVFDPTPSSLREFEQLRRILLRNNRPFILTDGKGKLIESHDPDIDIALHATFDDALAEAYSIYPPILIDAQGMVYKLYFKPSEVFYNIRDIFTALENSFSREALQITSDIHVPVLMTDSGGEVILAYANMDEKILYSREAVTKELRNMARENKPVEIVLSEEDGDICYVYYYSSAMLHNLRMMAWLLLVTLLLAILGVLVMLNFAQKMEQNQVWWGMSKETAHQLGTPLSSLLAWIDYYRMEENPVLTSENLDEIEKDVRRIELVTNRFSKIGSVPELNWENVVPVIYRAVDYLRGRSSSRVRYCIDKPENAVVMAQINASLLEWVMENLCKNALNAIEDKEGEIRIELSENEQSVFIDVEDNGKGMTQGLSAKIFDPGFTTKTRGWGMGLSLCKRIVEEYHEGKIFVRSTVPGQGSVFRIVLRKQVKNR